MLGSARARYKLECAAPREFNGAMGVDHHWLFFVLEDADATELERDFERARPIALPSGSRRALAKWQASPQALLTGDAGLLLGFHAAFRLGWAEALCHELERSHGLGFSKLTFSRIAPAQLLFSGLGPRRAMQLPGICGNLLVPREAISHAVEDVHRSCDIATEEFLGNARPFASGFASDAELMLTLEALPRALEHAERSKKALLGLSVSDVAFER
jgi:hypothetical protein